MRAWAVGVRWRAVVPWVLVVLVASTGSAGAAAMITGKQIRNNTVSSADIRNGSLTGLDVADGSLTWAELPPGSRDELVDTSPWEAIPPGRTVLGSFQTTYRTVAAGAPHVQSFQLPALPSQPLVGADRVNTAATSGLTDADPQCTGSFAEPSAPAGKVCVYLLYTANLASLTAAGYQNDVSFQRLGVFNVAWTDATAGVDAGFALTWAYTAP